MTLRAATETKIDTLGVDRVDPTFFFFKKKEGITSLIYEIDGPRLGIVFEIEGKFEVLDGLPEAPPR